MYVGRDQNHGPFWDLYYSLFLIVSLGDPKGPIIFINPHVRVYACLPDFWDGGSLPFSVEPVASRTRKRWVR